MSDALYNAPPFGALRDDNWVAVTMGRFFRRPWQSWHCLLFPAVRRVLPILGLPGGRSLAVQSFSR